MKPLPAGAVCVCVGVCAHELLPHLVGYIAVIYSSDFDARREEER